MIRLCIIITIALLAGAAIPSPIIAQTPAPATAAPVIPAPVTAAPATPAAAVAPATPAKGLASAIIPGSPLAALTGAAAPTDPDATPPVPFGTDNLGVSMVGQIADGTARTIAEFVRAIQQSTELTPVVQWLQSFPRSPLRTAHASQALQGLLETILPAILFETLVRLGLRRPRNTIIRIALARGKSDEPLDLNGDGLADAEAGETEKPPAHWLSPRAWLARLGLAFGYILLALLPIAGFVVVSGILIGTGLITNQAAHLIVVGFGNAYLFCRLSLEALLFVLAPRHTELRLIHTTDQRAAWLVRMLMLILVTVAFGYFSISSAEILGLSHDGTEVLGRLIALIVHLELAVLVWQSRFIVAGWIRGQPGDESKLFGLRPRFASIWHYVALFYIVALWVAYAGGVQNAFAVLLRIVAVFIGTLVLARLLWIGVTQGLDHVFHDAGTETRMPVFRARAKSYNPLLKFLARLAIGALVVVLILEGWGVQVIPWLIGNSLALILLSATIAIIITITVALVLWEISNAYLNARVEHLSASGRIRQASRLHTLVPILKATIGFTIALVAGLICLSKIGVDAAPLLAGAGVVGIAIGFGSQKLVQDIITGLFLLLEDAMQVGDIVNLAGLTGTVERLSIRTIRLRGYDGSVNIIPFSAVSSVTNMTRDFSYAQISIQVGYREDLSQVYTLMTEIAKTMRSEPRWGAMMRDDLKLFGLDQFGASALVITGQIRTGPGQHWAVRREYYMRVKQRFQAEHIEMPFYVYSRTVEPDQIETGDKEPGQEEAGPPRSGPAPEPKT
ncbi:MAG TPA: mechanosensitive ion channel [Acidocella sp.]|nr:MAG: hypothetical protein B7Z71_01075 [Acidocella sp. 21-58-7]HQU03688.1 mechanosensitive ion channel [Acidocella sp.]